MVEEKDTILHWMDKSLKSEENCMRPITKASERIGIYP